MDVSNLAHSLRTGNRRALAKAVTLIESQRPEDRARADALLEEVLPYTGKGKRVGISGPPGAGKSTLIEALGPRLLEGGQKLAILAIDPISPISGGSILGDKTRMERLARLPNVFIRPSPGDQGGLAARSRETLLLCEAAGFDWIIVETIGIGQSEIAVAGMTDAFIALTPPGAGDELQGMKRGIMEFADLLVVTKADGILADPADLLWSHCQQALRMVRRRRSEWQPRAILTSAVSGRGLAELVANLDAFFAQNGAAIAAERRRQNLAWFEAEIKEELRRAFWTVPKVRRALREIEPLIERMRRSPGKAARELVRHFIRAT
ncbi:MAG TPA: methylmalonyl Co-A mutase-associated GTPase MeaB [Dongiaceae bacterium]|jgi:LAO/AO transport system kinase|nr:methylmalonyl Co-A mutase-associated GTPase MeaB [Dongiaceae bacterium]